MSYDSPPAPRGRATMRQVAALCGVSVKTVSRVVNDETGVSPAVRERVRRAAAQLDFAPNLAASNLRRSTGRTGVVGVLVQDVGNDFSSRALRGIEDVARRWHSGVIVASLDEEPEREHALVAGLVNRRVDGLVLIPATGTQDYLMAERRVGFPVVFADRTPTGIDADWVVVDNRRGASEAVDHLVAHGHRRIATLGDLPGLQTAQLRHEGYLEALRSHGLEADPVLVRRGLRGEDEGRAETARLLTLPDPPTALFTTRNTLTIGAVRGLRDLGLQQQVALVGFDDLPLADLVEPGISVVAQHVEELGRAAAEILFDRLGGDTAPPRHVTVGHTLHVRGSGEIRPAG